MNIKSLLVAIIVAVGAFFAFKHWKAGNLESELLELPAYKALKEHDRPTYDKILAELKKGAEGESTKEEVIAASRKQLEVVVKERVPKASDEAVVTYINITMKELDELYERGDDTCHTFLFPQPGDVLDATKYFSKKLQKDDLAALGKVIETSAVSPQPLPSEQEFMERLMPVVESLAGEIGDDVGLIQNPLAPGIDKRKVCKVIRGLYSKILELPTEDAGKVLRYMIANS